MCLSDLLLNSLVVMDNGQRLQVFDRDRDGFISGGELRASMTNLGERLNDTEVGQPGIQGSLVELWQWQLISFWSQLWLTS